MFLSNKDKDINIKSAYLHLMNDALISAGIVAGGIIIYYTDWFWIDSTFSIVVAGNHYVRCLAASQVEFAFIP